MDGDILFNMNRSSTFLSFLFFCAALLPGTLWAQLPTVDIGMAPLEDGRLEVRLRPDENFSGLFAALVFTVRYPEASLASLGEFTAVASGQVSGVYPDLSGDVQYADGYAYATFAGFGLSTTNPSWTAGTEIILGHFAVNNGPGVFTLINDDWTGANNADYYVSLNGEEQTGIIYELSTGIGAGIEEAGAIEFFAAPGAMHGVLRMDGQEAGTAHAELIDAKGRLVHSWNVSVGAGANIIELRSPWVSSGLYRLRVQTPRTVFAAPWLIGER